MAGNQFGKIFSITTFGESHGNAIGVIIDGCPANISISEQEIQKELDRRKPGQSKLTTPRNEADKVQILSGIFQHKTLGTPITLLIKNEDARSEDYESYKEIYRPSHADFTYQEKYKFRDYRGGGRSSARETAARVAAGAIAKQIIRLSDITVQAFVHSVAEITISKLYTELDLTQIEANLVRCPDPEIALQMEHLIEQAKIKGDSLGGVIFCVIKNCPAGLGEPVFDKLQADLAKAMLSINAVKGFEYGSGFSGTLLSGSAHNDSFVLENNKVKTKSNFSGGIQGGISNGMDIYFKVGFKPVATIMQNQETLNQNQEKKIMKGKGRHDPCVLPRAVPIVEAMAALVIADHLLRNKTASW